MFSDDDIVEVALKCALLGDKAGALRAAERALAQAYRFNLPSLQALAHIRIGHALQIGPAPDLVDANQHYLQAIAYADQIGSEQTKIEAYLGLALLHGAGGDLLAAQAAAHAGRALAEQGNDRRSLALLWTASGILSVTYRLSDAERWLLDAEEQYRASKDTYGETVAQLWLAVQRQQHSGAAAPEQIRTLLALVHQHDYAGLFTRDTLFGPRDRMQLVPLLLAGRANPRWHDQAQHWLATSFPRIATDSMIQTYHPGSTLRVQTFGTLQVWRGSVAASPREWTRKKAPQLLALLLTHRDRWLLRDQICEWLWPGLSPTEAENQFKVTLNALNNVLEPQRPPRTPPFYIRRQGVAYRFIALDGVALDVDAFEDAITQARQTMSHGDTAAVAAAQQSLVLAVGLYADDYLAEYIYEEWTQTERDRLALRYLEAATLLGEIMLQRGQSYEAIQMGEMVLRRDACWEAAHRLLMRAYAQSGNRRQVIVTYERCVHSLRTQLDAVPMPQTTEVYTELRG